MAHPAPQPFLSNVDYGADIVAETDDYARLLGPIMAGARARGVADAFELMGLAVVLLDGAGRVLHAGGRAERALRPLVRITEDHLVGADATVNEALQRVVESALSDDLGQPMPGEIPFFDEGHRPRLTMTPMRFPQHTGSRGGQLLRAILLITEISA